MGRMGRKDTKPELLLRRGLHALGLRYRVNLRGLPGTPDVAFTRYCRPKANERSVRVLEHRSHGVLVAVPV